MEDLGEILNTNELNKAKATLQKLEIYSNQFKNLINICILSDKKDSGFLILLE